MICTRNDINNINVQWTLSILFDIIDTHALNIYITHYDTLTWIISIGYTTYMHETDYLDRTKQFTVLINDVS